jgi:hypothetical protein
MMAAVARSDQMPVVPLRRSKERNLVRALIGCALGAGLVMANAPARAGDDDPAELKIMDGLMGALGLSRTAPTIEYRERSPLVVPKGSALPPPQSASVSDPNWPVEPEVRQARALKATQKDDGLTSSQRMDQNALPLRPSELDRGRTTKSQNNPSAPDGSLKLFPGELGYKGGLFGTMFKADKDENVAKFTGEPPRTSLVAPPVGYQTPSPNQPYKSSRDKYTPTAIDSFTEHGTNLGK